MHAERTPPGIIRQMGKEQNEPRPVLSGRWKRSRTNPAPQKHTVHSQCVWRYNWEKRSRCARFVYINANKNMHGPSTSNVDTGLHNPCTSNVDTGVAHKIVKKQKRYNTDEGAYHFFLFEVEKFARART